MNYIHVAFAANLNRSADTLEKLASLIDPDLTKLESLEEMQAQVEAGAAIWGAVLHGLLTVPEIMERVDGLTASGYSEPDTLTNNGAECANLFLGVMQDFIYPMGEAALPTYSLCEDWEPSEDSRVMYRRNELRSESSGCRILARLIETGKSANVNNEPRGQAVIQTPRYVVSNDPPQITIDGTAYALAAKAATFFEALIVANGEWINGHSVVNQPSRIVAVMPLEVRLRVESEPGKGFRLKKDKVI